MPTTSFTGKDSLFGTAIRYWLGSREIEFWLVHNFFHPYRQALGPTQHLIQRVTSGVSSGWDVE